MFYFLLNLLQGVNFIYLVKRSGWLNHSDFVNFLGSPVESSPQRIFLTLLLCPETSLLHAALFIIKRNEKCNEDYENINYGNTMWGDMGFFQRTCKRANYHLPKAEILLLCLLIF